MRTIRVLPWAGRRSAFLPARHSDEGSLQNWPEKDSQVNHLNFSSLLLAHKEEFFDPLAWPWALKDGHTPVDTEEFGYPLRLTDQKGRD